MAMNALLDVCTPQIWSSMRHEEVKLHNLSQNDDEYISVAQKVNNTFNVDIESVERIQNPFIWGCYNLKKLEYEAKGIPVREVEMFHCTAEYNIDSIATDNLDWRRCTRSKFGKGVSFSPSAKYANRYANYDIGTERALILAKVLVGSAVHGNPSMIIPPIPFDTSVGNCTGGTLMVYVKFCDYEFYPTHVVYYNWHEMF